MDSYWRDGDRTAGKMLIVKGNWHLEFWAKGKQNGDQLRVAFYRENEANFINQTISLTTDWQKYEFDVFVPEGMDGAAPYTNDEYHPILGLSFYICEQGDEAWVDDGSDKVKICLTTLDKIPNWLSMNSTSTRPRATRPSTPVTILSQA